MTIEELEVQVQSLLYSYQLNKGTTLAADEVLQMLERQKERIYESLDDYYSTFC